MDNLFILLLFVLVLSIFLDFELINKDTIDENIIKDIYNFIKIYI